MTQTHEITGGGLTTGTDVGPADQHRPWHSNTHLRVASGPADLFQSMRTRHQPPQTSPWSTDTLMALPSGRKRRLIAVHEAGHLITGLRLGIGPLKEVRIADDVDCSAGVAVSDDGTETAMGGYVDWGYWYGPWDTYATMLAAGEQAQLHWLQDQGLYTDPRGWVVETYAWHDRYTATATASTASDPITMTFGRPGTADCDWADLLDQADQHITAAWSGLIRIAEALDLRGRLSPADVERILR